MNWARKMRPFKPLLIGGRRGVSLGRLSFWLIFGLSVYFWLARPAAEFPASLNDSLMMVLAYNLGSKAVYNLAARRSNQENSNEHFDPG